MNALHVNLTEDYVRRFDVDDQKRVIKKKKKDRSTNNKKSKSRGEGRMFSPKLLKDFEFLYWNTKLSEPRCFCCDVVGAVNNRNETWSLTDFNSPKHSCNRHFGTDTLNCPAYHSTAVQTFKDRFKTGCPKNNFDRPNLGEKFQASLRKATQKARSVRDKNTNQLLKIIYTVQTLACQKIAFRGHRNESIESTVRSKMLARLPQFGHFGRFLE